VFINVVAPVCNIWYLDNMYFGSESRSLAQVRIALEAALGPSAGLAAEPEPPSAGGLDLILRGRDAMYGIEYKSAGDAASVGAALRQLRHFPRDKGSRTPHVPIVAVPYMGETGRRLCDEAGVSWIDLSGNAWIETPSRQIRILGNRNRFLARGRPANVFAPKSSRVIRTLLMEPRRAFSQAELVAASGVDRGRVSRLVRRMETMGLLAIDPPGHRLRDPSLALEAWREAYDFSRHHLLEGHVSVREPTELIARLQGSSRLSWALTGLVAAWQYSRFAMYRLISFFVREVPSPKWFDSIGFVAEPRGANVWIISPTDDSVFVGSRVVRGVPCVHPLQVYLDLKAHPERAAEAAAQLRPLALNGKAGGG